MDLYGRSPARGFNKRPMKGWKGRSPVKARSQRSISRSPPYSRSPVKVSRSRSPVRSSRRSASRSSGRFRSRKTASRSLLRAPSGNNHRSYSRSPSPVARRVRSPLSPDRGRSLSRSVSPDASPKRVRRGRGFSQRYSYARRYRTPSLSPPVRSYRYGGGRSDRDRYSSYRRSRYSPRRYRSPPRRTPPRYRSRRSRSPVSRSLKLHIPIVTPLLNLLQAGIIMLRSADLSNEQMATYSQAGSYAN
ncbi:hypothetical protein ACFX2J_014228 [Malus domestica]